MNYSLVLRGDPRDPSKPKKVFASPQSHQVLDIEQLADYISMHGCVYHKGDIMAVTSILTEAITYQLRCGNQVDLGDLGKFYVTLDCEGADSVEDFDPQHNIRGFRPHWKPSQKFLHLRDKVTFKENVDRRTEKRLLREEAQRRNEAESTEQAED